MRFYRLQKLWILSLLFSMLALGLKAEMLIPMDRSQTNHLKAYGVAFSALQDQLVVKWLLNYRGGSFLMPSTPEIIAICNIRGVSYENISSAQIAAVLSEIQEANMEAVTLEKEPKIGVYIPPNTLPWDDAV
ncbi:MAG: asparagine synthetase B, partial [Candidatus Cloacimonetes bacterium]|nr:asparagine synthetase B [Candidatus Cloacimonadota bacterium]